MVSSHTNPSLSGVARFNRELARVLGAACVGLGDRPLIDAGPVLLSIKLQDSRDGEVARLDELLADWKARRISYDVFFHTFSALDVEHRCLDGCRTAYAGNAEIVRDLQAGGRSVVAAWCPPLVNPDRRLREAQLNVFSFGMAHKIQVVHYKALHRLLESTGADYSLWVSTAFHEKAEFGDFDSICDELTTIMGTRVQFLGFLSDEALNHFLVRAHLFVSFFPKGVRANNTSVAAAMSLQRPVLTNLDEYSPSWLEHGRNVLDINRVRADDLRPERLQAIGANGMAAIRGQWDWDTLRELLT